MKYNILGYLIGEGFSNVFKNKKSTGASLVIMCATMIIFGVFLILGENINHFVDNLKADQGFSVFIKVDATQEEIDKVGEEIRAIDGVNTVDFVSKDDALNIMRERLKDTKGVLDGFDKELLKTSYTVTVTDLSKSKDIQNQINGIENVAKIESSDETVAALVNIANGITITSALVNIFAESLLVLYSSSILMISSLLLSFNMYLFKNGIRAYLTYNF